MYTETQKRKHIYDLQRFLRRIQRAQGVSEPLSPDGIFGPETAAAVRDFQRSNSLPVTGASDFATWTLIFAQYLAQIPGDSLPAAVSFFPTGADAILSPGDRSSSVAALQLMLNTSSPHFFNTRPLPLTGEYDTATAAAICQMQHAFQMPETGATNRATWELLASLHNSLFSRIPLQWQLME